MLVNILLLIFAGFLGSIECFVFMPLARARVSQVNMLFGGGNKPANAKGGKIVITVDGGKVIESSEASVNLRKVLMENKVDVYPLKGKLSNCGGAGICGTCAVKVLSGSQFINPPSKNEQNTLKGKASDIRLSCCSRVTGPISIKTKP